MINEHIERPKRKKTFLKLIKNCKKGSLLSKKLISFLPGSTFSQKKKELCLMCKNEQPPLLGFCSHNDWLSIDNMRADLFLIPTSNPYLSPIPKVVCLCFDFVAGI